MTNDDLLERRRRLVGWNVEGFTMRGDFSEERLRRQEELLEREDRIAAGGIIFYPDGTVEGGGVRHMTVEEINRIADAQEWSDERRAFFLGRKASGDVVVEVTAGSILLGGAGPILVGAGVPLPSFLELPRPSWCYPGASG